MTTTTQRAMTAASKVQALSASVAARVKAMQPSWERSVLDARSATLFCLAGEVARYAAKVAAADTEFQAAGFADYCERKAAIAARIAA